MRNIKLSFFIVLLSFATVAFAQDDDRPKPTKEEGSSFKDKVFFGGGFGVGFGNYTYVNISPIIGYRVTPRLSTALRFMYQYTTYDYYDYQAQETMNYSGNDYGIGGFARFMVYGPVYLQAEYEHLNYDGLDYTGSYRSTFDSFMAGAGIAQPVGRNVFLFFTAMYNFSYDNFNSNNVYRTPYDSPWVIRIGVTAGF